MIESVFGARLISPGIQRILWERYFKDPQFRAAVLHLEQRVREALETLLAALAGEGRLRALDAHAASFVIHTSVEWTASRLVLGDADVAQRSRGGGRDRHGVALPVRDRRTPMTAFDLATLDIISPDHYVRHGYPHPEWKYLRRHAPVFWYEGRTDVDPFWAITKHADVIELSKQPELFQNEPELAIFPNEFAQPEENPARHLLNMDPPDHGKYRRAAAKQFTPRTVTELAPHVDEMTREILDAAAAKGQGDFVADVSAPLTIGVIADMLGVPAADRPLMFRWTNEVIAPTDPEFQRGLPEETLEKARLELFAYFKNLSDERRKRPTQDIVSTVANGTVDGRPLPDFELLSYYLLLVVAGNETTRNAMTGGMLAFIENPGEWEKLRREPGAPRLRGGGDRALDLAGDPVRAHAEARLRAAWQEDPRRRALLPVLPLGEPRRGGVPGRRRASASTASRTTTSPSGAASTSASARTSRASSCAPRSATSSSASRTSSWRGPWTARARPSSAASSARRCAGSSAPRAADPAQEP